MLQNRKVLALVRFISNYYTFIRNIFVPICEMQCRIHCWIASTEAFAFCLKRMNVYFVVCRYGLHRMINRIAALTAVIMRHCGKATSMGMMKISCYCTQIHPISSSIHISSDLRSHFNIWQRPLCVPTALNYSTAYLYKSRLLIAMFDFTKRIIKLIWQRSFDLVLTYYACDGFDTG